MFGLLGPFGGGFLPVFGFLLNSPPALPNTPIALRVPPRCESCGREGAVRLQQNINGQQIVLHWHCNDCDHEWPVRRREEEPSRESA